LPKLFRRLLWIGCLGALLPLHAQAEEPKDALEQSQLAAMLDKARTLLGIPYHFGGTSPTRGFDCSGFVRFVFKSFGVDLDRTSRSQSRQGDPVPLDDLKPGDLLFFATRGVRQGVSHVGIYLGDGQFIHASAWHGPGMHCVELGKLTTKYFADRLVAARRFVTGEKDAETSAGK